MKTQKMTDNVKEDREIRYKERRQDSLSITPFLKTKPS